MEMNMKRAKLFGIATAIGFMLIHIFLIFVFHQCGVTPMVRLNIFSIIFYVFAAYAMYKDLFKTYAIGIYIEVIVHMTMAVIYTGWDSGFQVTLIGVNVLALYSEYVGRTLKIKCAPMLPFTMAMITHTIAGSIASVTTKLLV